MKRHRIVLDTNVLISAILFGGPPRAVLDLAISGTVDCSLSLPILDELRDVLCRPKFSFSLEQSLRVVEELHAVCDIVAPADRIVVLTSDPDDNRMLECALSAGAAFIVSGDRHLLDLGQYEGVVILSPTAYLSTIRSMTKAPTKPSRRRR